MSNKRDYYEVLGISKTSSQQEIKKAFRKKAMEFHPDRNKASDAEDKFKEINEANEVLSDENKRTKYDQYGHAAFEGGGQGGFGGFEGFDINDIFSQFFGGGRSRNAPTKGDDYQMRMNIQFLESVTGKTIVQKMDKYVDGEVVKKEIEIEIPEGIKDGMSILVRDFGGKGRNAGPNGDLYIKVNVKPHHSFVREGYDVHLKVPVSILELIAEKSIRIPTIYGDVDLKLNSKMQSDEVITIPRKGFKAIRQNYVGDMKVHLVFFVPKMSMKETSELSEQSRKSKDRTFEKWFKKFK